MNLYKLSTVLAVVALMAFPIACTSAGQKSAAPKKPVQQVGPTPTPFVNNFGDDGDDKKDDEMDDDKDSDRRTDDIDCDDVVSFNQDIERLMQKDCVSCHDNGGTKPYLEDFEDVKDNAEDSLKEVKNGDMPKNADEWSSSQIRLLEDWIDQGFPEDIDDVKCEGDSDKDSDDRDNDRNSDFDKNEARKELLESEEYKECKADDRVYYRGDDKKCCTVARVADYTCNAKNLINAFDDAGIDLEEFLDKNGVDLDDWEIEQCGEYKGAPVAVLVRDKPGTEDDDDKVELQFRNIKADTGAFQCR